MAQMKSDEIKESVDVDIYLAFANALIEKYGNFKMSQDLHNMIIRNLAQICTQVEQINAKD